MEKKYILTLMMTPKIGRKTVFNILNTMEHEPSNIQDLHQLINDAKIKNNRIHLPSLGELNKAYSKVDFLMGRLEKHELKIFSFLDNEYPKKLKIIEDPPVIIYAKGDVTTLSAELSTAVVGTREPTNYGKEIAGKFGEFLGEKNIVVVSGLAIGCDSAAQNGCIKANGKTVAVLANGLDTVYPATNKQLAEDIVNTGGCLLSEYPPGTKIRSNYFVERDRLQSGLSDGVIVIETDIKGGTMHTARFCKEQNRILACLKHPENEETQKSNGNKHLIENKSAKPIETLDDLNGFIEDLVENNNRQESQDNNMKYKQIRFMD